MKPPFYPVSAVLISLTLAAAAVAGDWPQWHGPTRDCRVSAGSPVPTTLPKELATVWKIKIGGGHSSPVVSAGKLVYFDENGTDEVVHCLDAKTARELWQTPIAALYTDEWGPGPRSTPVIDGGHVYQQTSSGEFRCLKMSDGKIVWGVSFEKDYGVKFGGNPKATAARRGNNGTCLVEGDSVYVPVGSTEGATLVCFDKSTGSVKWKSGNDEAAYSAPVAARLAGVDQIVYLSADSLAGYDRQSGKILWRQPVVTNAKRHACTPVINGDTVTINSHTIGTVCFKISKSDNGLAASQLWANKAVKTNLATPAQVGGLLFNQGTSATKEYVCFDALTGATKWTQTGFGGINKDYSSSLVLGKNILVLTYSGELVLIAPNPDKYTELGRLQVCGSTWSFPAYVDGKLFVRDTKELSCIDLMAAK